MSKLFNWYSELDALFGVTVILSSVILKFLTFDGNTKLIDVTLRKLSMWRRAERALCVSKLFGNE